MKELERLDGEVGSKIAANVREDLALLVDLELREQPRGQRGQDGLLGARLGDAASARAAAGDATAPPLPPSAPAPPPPVRVSLRSVGPHGPT